MNSERLEVLPVCRPIQSRPRGGRRRKARAHHVGWAGRWAVLAVYLPAWSLWAAPLVYENASEFSLSADLDQDGRSDLVIVDRFSGDYRIGYQWVDGGFNWVDARPSGLENITGVTAGRLRSTTLEALAFTAPDANRINVFAADNPNLASQPFALFGTGIGPASIVALDMGGAGNTAHDDLFIGSDANGQNPFLRESARNQGSQLTGLGANTAAGRSARANRVLLKTDVPLMAGLLERGPVNDQFRVYRFTTGAGVEVAATGANLPVSADYVYGDFMATSSLAQFLFYQPGSPNLHLRAVQEPTPGVFGFGAGPTFNLGSPLHQVLTFEQDNQPRLLVILNAGATARVYDFDGTNPPVPGQTFNAPPGETFTSAGILSNGRFALYSGAPGSGRSSRFQHYLPDGNSHVAGVGGALPSLGARSRRANILNFQFEPFVSPQPRLLETLNAGDWSSAPLLAGGAQLSVTAEEFLDATAGLGGPAAINVGTVHPSTQFVLVNQYLGPISLFSLNRPIGREIAELRISPAPGWQPTSVQVVLSATTPNIAIYYRMSEAADWVLYSGPFWLFRDTTIACYGKPAGATGGERSVIRHAAYTFAEGPGTLDSDGDDVPDYVEVAKGLDPVSSGNDADGDGFFDLDELTANTDPADANSHPPSQHPRLELNAAVDLVQTPRPLDGTTGQLTHSALGVALGAYDLDGSLLGLGQTEPPPPGVTGATAWLPDVAVDTQARWLTVATEPHYAVITTAPNKQIGRELLRLYDTAAFRQPLVLAPTWSGGPLATEAAAWINSAKLQLQQAARKQIAGELNHLDTLTALLIEYKTSQIFVSRGFTAYADLTLFPFRAGDVGQPTPSREELLDLERRAAGNLPAFRLRDLLGSVENALGQPPATDPYLVLKQVAAEVYRIASASNNIPANVTVWPAYPSPVDTLRGFLRTGQLHSNYLAATTLNGSQLTTAKTTADQLLASLGERPLVTLNLRVRGDTFDGPCTVLDQIGANQTVALFHPDDIPYRLLEAFQLPVGTAIAVAGYPDVDALGCAQLGLEVIALTLGSVPAITPEDTDGDLLADALEWMLFGTLGQGAFGDFDSDGVSNLQEVLDGTDPADNGVKGTAAPNFQLPAVQVQWTPGGQLKLVWLWPQAYANQVQFNVLSAAALEAGFQLLPLAAVPAGPDTFEALLPEPVQQAQFFLISLQLK